MLVLARKKDEKVVIGDRMVVVTVISIVGDKVRLGFEASGDIPIHREEVYEALKRKERSEQSAKSDREE